MKREMRVCSRLSPGLVCLATAALLAAAPAAAQLQETPERLIRIGFVIDGPAEGNETILTTYKREIAELLKDEYDVRFPPEKTLVADWTASGVKGAVDELLSDPAVDFVVALGLIASQDLGRRGPLPKPSVAAMVVDPELQSLPMETREVPLAARETETIDASGVENFTYITTGARLVEEVRVFRRLAPFRRLAVLVMEGVLKIFPGLVENAREQLTAEGIEAVVVPVGASLDEALAAIPPDAGAVYVGPLPHLSKQERKRLAEALIERRLPGFSAEGVEEVELGLLATLAPATTHVRRARRVGIDIQQILEGKNAAELPVDFSRRSSLTINMATARAIGVSPPQVMLINADLFHEEVERAPRTLSLSSVVREAENVNLDLAVADRNVAAGLQLVKLARAALLPQIGISGGGIFIDKDRARLGAGQNPQHLAFGTVSASQLIYSDDVKASYDIEKRFQELRTEERAQVRLDIIQEAAESYLNVLRAKTIERVQKDNLKLTRSNLELARIRVEVGQAGREELFRWESQLAVNKRDVVDAVALRNQAAIALNRVLNRAIEEAFLIQEAGLDDPELVTSFEQLRPYIETPKAFTLFRDFMTQEAFRQSPELRQLEAAVLAQQREVTAAKRSFYVPRVGATAEGSYLGRYREGSAAPPPPFDTFFTNPYNWTLSITGSLPVFQGGAQHARLGRARQELRRVTTEREAVKLRIEERIRAILHQANASFIGIELARDAADAAWRNLELVKDRYAEGIADILTLLDAQNQALTAELRAANAVFDYLIDQTSVQRAVGRFDYYRSAQDRQEFLNRLDEYFRQAGYPVQGK